MNPDRILDHGDIRIAWHEAHLTRPIHLDDDVLPTGTTGYFRRTSRHRGTFLPMTLDYGIQIHANDLEISPQYVEVQYTIGATP